MTAAAWKPEKDICRCCHAEGSYHNLSEPRFVLGQTEVYSDMLKSCFNVELSTVSGMLSAPTFTICEPCILRLRDASNFKKQVLRCEERFKDMFKNIIQALRPEFDVKQEVRDDNPEVKVEFVHMDDEDDAVDMKFDDSDDDQPVIQIKVEQHSKKKGKTKVKSKPKSKKPVKNQELNEEAAIEIGNSIADEPDMGEDGEDESSKPKKGARHQKFFLKDSDFRTEDDNYICSHCDKKYDKIFSLRFHIKTKHYKIARFPCPYCKQEFMTPAPLTVHKLQEHNIDERFKCKACNAVFNTKVQLRKHINNFHMLGEKYKCEFCDYESFSFEGMYKHKFKHKTVKDYHCRFCRKSFLRKATLDLHERIHTGDRRKVCNVCGQAFVQKASLNYHMTKYHPEVNF
uniref:Protein krueppel n=1 Tax=Pectinophora gossypiella TaxID=13191 RepID=A0A1E1W112_PECGO